jgi:lipopolysaccharide/colanic/teichoic acid biosynthesis glycosyltransferase
MSIDTETILHSLPLEAALREPEPLRASLLPQVKRAADVVLGAILLVLAAPVMLLMMILVKLGSRGPAIYSQVRLGRHGRPFVLHKIRTMFNDCESRSGPRWASANDPRIAPFGNFLRRSHLDELPQLWNVVIGDMSLVGPRPERPEFVTVLERELPAYRDRLLVRPGLTGLAQLELPADTNLASVQRKLAHDLYYVDQLTLGLDLRLLMFTACYLAGFYPHLPRRLVGLPDREAILQTYARRCRRSGTVPPRIAWDQDLRPPFEAAAAQQR